MKAKQVTTQPQGQVSALAKEPKDKKQIEREQLKDKLIEEVLAVIPYTPEGRKELLTEALGRVTAVTAKVDKLLKTEPLIRRIFNDLPIKSKAVICVLQMITSAEGITNEVQYGSDLLYNLYQDKSILETALAELPDDKDILALDETYDLASFISREGKTSPSQETEATGAEPIAEQPQPEGSDPAEITKQWLLRQSYTVKLACTLLMGYQLGDHNTEELARDVYAQFEKEVLAQANSPSDSLSTEEVFITGIATENLVWQDHFYQGRRS
jgi:hypothetical protein